MLNKPIFKYIIFDTIISFINILVPSDHDEAVAWRESQKDLAAVAFVRLASLLEIPTASASFRRDSLAPAPV